MYLSQIEIFGFKSFATKTRIVFSRGMSAIVGPNGCGKTNVVDALRWVLGEQKSAILRSEVMDNVIFNGTGSRKPLGMAEVTLTIKDNDGILPADYSEVAITRRLYRSGESEYLINNAKCRLKDITDLFMDTGLGSDTYSVIELKMIESILSGKPEERRHLIEEAAGINKFKQRRKEATNKLSNIQDDLLRINDLVAEVGKLVGSLSRQAAKTRRYNKLMERHKELERGLLLIDFKSAKNEADRLASEIKSVALQRDSAVKEIESAENDLKTLQEKQSAAENDYSKSKNIENSINSDISDKDKNIAVEKEKQKSLENEQKRLHSEIDNINFNTQKALSSVGNAKLRLEKIQSEKQENAELITDLRKNRDIAAENVRDAHDEYDELQETSITLQNNLNSMKTTLLKNRNRKENLEIQLDKSYNDIEKINNDAAELEKQKNNLEIQKDKLASTLESAKIKLQEATDKIAALKAEIDNVKSETAATKNNLNSKNSALEFLKNLLYVDDTSKYLLQNASWKQNPGFDTVFLEEAVSVDEKYRVAVEAALGQYAGYFVVPNNAVAKKAISLLQSSGKGKAGFVCRDSVPPCSAPAQKNYNNSQVLGRVSEFVRTDDTLRSFLRITLGDMVITENFASANDVVISGEASRAVALTGEIVSYFGDIRAGGTLKKEGQTVGKQERISALSDEIKMLGDKIKQLNEQYSKLINQLNSINLSSLEQSVKSAEDAFEKNRQNIMQSGYKIDSLKNSIKVYETSSARFQEEIAAIDLETNNLNTEIQEAEKSAEISKENLQVVKNKLGTIESDLKKHEQNLKSAEMNRIRIEASENAIKNDLNRYTANIDNADRRSENLGKQIKDNEKTAAALSISIDKLENELSALKLQYTEAKNKSDQINAVKFDMEEQIKTENGEISMKRKFLDKILENLHSAELKAENTNAKLDGIKSKALENIDLNLDDLTPDKISEIEIPEGIDNARSELASIKDNLLKLGNVNFMALEEYEKQAERLKFYEEQVNDLTESQNTLQETIREINDTAVKRFRETFDVVNNNFQMMFRKLFSPEAESSLALTGSDILDCDIEITARPPGKKPLSIEMLSQGEKTLTAISLLFAIYLVKPSPFCILDEVDAPLDDMNIDRFLNMIRDFSKNTQFMIITHNKKTMTAADTLYGITMQEEGISKTVSVKLTEVE